MLKGISKVVKSKNIYNYVALIKVFMQSWFPNEERTKQVPPSTFQDASGHITKQIWQHLWNTHRPLWAKNQSPK